MYRSFFLLLTFAVISSSAFGEVTKAKAEKLVTLIAKHKSQAVERQIDLSNVKSAGVVILLEAEKDEYEILLGKRVSRTVDWKTKTLTDPRYDDKTWGTPHGDFIVNAKWGISDRDAFDTAFRKTLAELFFVDVTSSGVFSPFEDENNIDAALVFLEALDLVAVLKNNAWETERRPHFVFMLSKASNELLAKYWTEFKHLSSAKLVLWNDGKAKTPPDLSNLRFFTFRNLANAISAVALKEAPFIAREQRVLVEGKRAIYDSLARTLALPVNTDIIEKFTATTKRQANELAASSEKERNTLGGFTIDEDALEHLLH